MPKLRIAYMTWKYIDIEVSQDEAEEYDRGPRYSDDLLDRVYLEAEQTMRPLVAGQDYEWLEEDPELMDYIKPTQLEMF